MQIAAISRILALLILANGAPVLAKKICRRRLARPLDSGGMFSDGQPVFGPSKTFRGTAAAVLTTTAASPLVGLTPTIGATVGSAAMAGDLLSSFVKRRLNLPPSSQALGLDQIPESLFPMLACRGALSLTAAEIALGVGLFFGGELVLSRLLFRVHLRDVPY
jgi:CDP-2,3-bis-(O-geranylgeranyl)-sn-glycerol synthase